MQTNRFYACADSLLKSVAVLILALFGGACAANDRYTPEHSYPSSTPPAAKQSESESTSSISLTPESRSSANKIVKLVLNLESNELNADISSVKEQLSELQNEAARTEIGNLTSMKNYLLLWQWSLGERAGTIVEEFNTTYNNTLNDVKKLHLDAQGRANISSSVNANGNFDWEHSISTNKTGSRVIKFQGGMNDRNLRMLREESRITFLNDLRVNGLGLLASSSDLVGNWSWRWTKGKGPATVNLELKPDFTMQAEIVPDNPGDWRDKAGFNEAWANGWGNWSINDGVLRIQMVKVGIWPVGVSYPFTFIDNRQIVWFDDHKVILDGPDDNILEKKVP